MHCKSQVNPGMQAQGRAINCSKEHSAAPHMKYSAQPAFRSKSNWGMCGTCSRGGGKPPRRPRPPQAAGAGDQGRDGHPPREQRETELAIILCMLPHMMVGRTLIPQWRDQYARMQLDQPVFVLNWVDQAMAASWQLVVLRTLRIARRAKLHGKLPWLRARPWVLPVVSLVLVCWMTDMLVANAMRRRRRAEWHTESGTNRFWYQEDAWLITGIWWGGVFLCTRNLLVPEVRRVCSPRCAELRELCRRWYLYGFRFNL